MKLEESVISHEHLTPRKMHGVAITFVSLNHEDVSAVGTLQISWKALRLVNKPPQFFSCHFPEENQSFKCAIPRRINNSFRGSNHILTAQTMPPGRTITTHPPTQDNNDPPPSLYLGDLTFCIKFAPWKMGKPQPIHSIWGSNDHGQRKKEPGKTWPAWAKFSLIFFLWLISTKKKVSLMLLWRVFVWSTHGCCICFNDFYPAKLGHSSQTLTSCISFPSFIFWNFNQF